MVPEKKLKKFRLDVFFAILFAAAVVFSLWKCPYGYISDDGFYLTVPHRLSMGDVLFADEWHVSQMAGLLTTPLVWLYRTVVGSTDGILLAGRYAYVVCHALAAGAAYLCLRKYGAAGAAAILSWFLFVPYDIMALSYNTMAMDLILLSCVLLAATEKTWCWTLSGVFLACAVLCCPYFAASWFCYAAGIGMRALWLRWKSAGERVNRGILAPSRLLWLTAGTAAVAALFLFYILRTCGIRGVWRNLPHILSDPEHTGASLTEKLQYGWHQLVHCHPLFPLVLLGFAALLLVMLLDRSRREHREAYLIASCVLTLASYALFWPNLTKEYYNGVMLPMAFVGVTAFVLCRQRPWELFVTLFLGGSMYSAAVTLGSNNYFYAFSMSSAVTNTASLLFLGRLLQELMEDRQDGSAIPMENRRGGSVIPLISRAALGMAALTVASLLVCQVNSKAHHCLMDDPPSELTCRLRGGPGDGLLTTDYKAQVYHRLNEMLQPYKDLPPGKLLILNMRSWCYLVTDPMEYATFSAWFGDENASALSRMENYYALNPEKVPQYIFMAKNAGFDSLDSIVSTAVSHGYVLTESDFAYYLQRD